MQADKNQLTPKNLQENAFNYIKEVHKKEFEDYMKLLVHFVSRTHVRFSWTRELERHPSYEGVHYNQCRLLLMAEFLKRNPTYGDSLSLVPLEGNQNA